MLQQRLPLPEQCAWGREAPPTLYIAYVGEPPPEELAPTITEATEEGAALGVPITDVVDGWVVGEPEQGEDEDGGEDGEGGGSALPRPLQAISLSSTGSRLSHAGHPVPQMLSPRAMAMTRGPPVELRPASRGSSAGERPEGPVTPMAAASRAVLPGHVG